MKDLKELEVSCTELPNGEIRKAILCPIVGDNFGSHCIGGFVETFSTNRFFCRLCEIGKKEEFETDPLSIGPTRTVRHIKIMSWLKI